MTQSQSSPNPWLVSYINQNYPSKSRSEIDSYLINAGYRPAEIEIVWQSLSYKNSNSSPDSFNSDVRLGAVVVYLIGIFLLDFSWMFGDSTVMVASAISFAFLVIALRVDRNASGKWKLSYFLLAFFWPLLAFFLFIFLSTAIYFLQGGKCSVQCFP